MIKKLNYYSGNVILGYRLVIPKVPVTGYVKMNKGVYRLPEKNNNNTLKCLKVVRKRTVK
jgi:hypothetical protein